MRFRLPLALPLISTGLFLLAVGSSPAVQILSGDNTTAPGTNFNGSTFLSALPWDNVGQVNGASAVFIGDPLGNGTFWMITAGHVASSLPATVTLGSTAYSTVAGSYKQLHNPDNSLTDLAIFRLNISSLPSGLGTLSLSSTLNAPITGDDIYYVGYGGGTKRWGFNDKEPGSFNIDDGFAHAIAFRTDYDTDSANGNEAQAITGDSGGAAFFYNTLTNTWQLAGVMLAVDNASSPALTYSANIATYRAEIIASVPEPSTLALLGLGALVFARRRRAA